MEGGKNPRIIQVRVSCRGLSCPGAFSRWWHHSSRVTNGCRRPTHCGDVFLPTARSGVNLKERRGEHETAWQFFKLIIFCYSVVVFFLVILSSLSSLLRLASICHRGKKVRGWTDVLRFYFKGQPECWFICDTSGFYFVKNITNFRKMWTGEKNAVPLHTRNKLWTLHIIHALSR